mmetsp:Transcript_24392/g.34972  ORF Transcript_24392/g.34972 Transcript_24392/m.34972 type:complete len:148 (+) Transcript_24392:207-650(+)
MQLQQAPTGNQRGRSSVRSRRIRSHSICNNKIIKKDSMIQLALANWSDLFQPRRSRSLDSRVNPKGNTAAPQRAQNAPPLLSQSPASPPSTFSQPIQHDVVADDDDSYLLPWGDKPVPIDTGKVLRVFIKMLPMACLPVEVILPCFL